MKLTASQLRQIIREELTVSLNEDDTFQWKPGDTYSDRNYDGPVPHLRKVLPWKEGEQSAHPRLPLPGGYIVLNNKVGDDYFFWTISERDPLKHGSWTALMASKPSATTRISADSVEKFTEPASDINQGLEGFGAGLPGYQKR